MKKLLALVFSAFLGAAVPGLLVAPACAQTISAAPVNQKAVQLFDNVAGVTAARIPASVNFVRTAGYTTAGDGGGSLYARRGSAPSHPGKLQSADGAWWELIPESVGVNVKSLGAKGDGVTDDTTAIANAILVARALPVLKVYGPAATYEVTQSLDFTYSTTGNHYLSLFGDGQGKTIFDCSGMTEAYPCIDFTGNAGGVAKGFRAQINGSASLATTLFLAAKNANLNSGNAVMIDDVLFVMPRSNFNANNYAGAVVASVDRSIIRNSAAYGPRGWIISGYRPSAVSSKFQSHNAQVDWTQMACESCVGVGSTGAALTTSGAIKFSGATYFAMESSGGAGQNPAIIDIYAEGTASPSTATLDGYIRTENQSGTTGVSAFRLRIAAGEWHIRGEANTDSSGKIFTGPSGLDGSDLQLDTSAPTPLFDSNVVVTRVRLLTGSISLLGSPASLVGFDVVGGGITSAMLQPYKQWSLRRNDGVTNRSGDSYLTNGAASANIQETGMYTMFVPSITAYTGGSGEQAVTTWTIPANLLTNYQALGGRLAVPITYRIKGNRNGGASGRIRINFTQGANSVDVYDSGAALPAGNVEFTMDVEVMNLSSDALRAHTQGFAGGARAPGKTTNLQGFSFTKASDITVTIYITDTNSSPLSITTIKGVWG